MTAIFLTVAGLCLFEIISSIDNAIINAEVLGTMKPQSRKWFFVWGIFIAVFLIRGGLPWLLVWIVMPHMGAIDALLSTFSSDPDVLSAVEKASPILLAGGGTFLLLLFVHWLFSEPKDAVLAIAKFVDGRTSWFFAVVVVLLGGILLCTLRVNPLMTLSVALGTVVFFVSQKLKGHAARAGTSLVQKKASDVSKILYLEVLDATFSIDSVLGAFAFTFSVPLILLGNGLGAIVVRQLTLGNMKRIQEYKYLKNGAMYSIFILGIIMLVDAFGFTVPEWLSPIVTFVIIGWFFWRSRCVMTRG